MPEVMLLRAKKRVNLTLDSRERYHRATETLKREASLRLPTREAESPNPAEAGPAAEPEGPAHLNLVTGTLKPEERRQPNREAENPSPAEAGRVPVGPGPMPKATKTLTAVAREPWILESEMLPGSHPT